MKKLIFLAFLGITILSFGQQQAPNIPNQQEGEQNYFQLKKEAEDIIEVISANPESC